MGRCNEQKNKTVCFIWRGEKERETWKSTLPRNKERGNFKRNYLRGAHNGHQRDWPHDATEKKHAIALGRGLSKLQHGTKPVASWTVCGIDIG